MTRPLPKPLDREAYVDLTGMMQEACDVLTKLTNIKDTVFIDFETNHVKQFADDFEILSVALTLDKGETWFIPLSMGNWGDKNLMQIEHCLSQFLLSKTPKVAQNLAFEDISSRVRLTHGMPVTNWSYDTMLGAHVLNEERKITNLDFLVFESFGDYYSDEVDKKRMKATPLKTLGRYNCLDTRYLPPIMTHQHTSMTDGQWDAYCFFHDCLLDMIDAQCVGIGVDFDELTRFEGKVVERTATAMATLDGNKLVERFRNKHNREPSTSGDDAIEIIYKLGKGTVVATTAKACKPSMKDEDLQLVARATQSSPELSEYVDAIQCINQMGKLSGTYTKNLRQLADGKGLIHPAFLLHIARTYRSSSANPNFQNFPKRDEFGHQLRKCLVPAVGDVFIEGDIKGAEWSVGAMLAHDEVMLDEIRNGFDPHRYWASQLYEKDESDVTKEERFVGKNSLVFPWRYGSYFVSIARTTGIDERLVDEVIKKMEKRYHRTKRFMDEQWAFYQKKLYVETPLGFRRHAPLSKNMTLNTVVQATSFHLLLAGLHKVNATLKSDFKSRLCGQIHDSGVLAAFNEERNSVIDTCNGLMGEIHFPKWQTDSISLEWESGPNLYEMKPIDVPF